jgi:hypothetical protein
MRTTVNPKRNGRTLARTFVLGLLALAAALSQSLEARAQWTQPDAQGNISTSNTGNVGIGTTTPPYTLSVLKDQVGSTTFGVFNRSDGAATIAAMGVGRVLDWSDKYMTFGVTAPSFGVPGLNDVGIFHSKGVPLKFGSESAHDLLFFTNGYNNTRMAITGGGNVGIGTTTPQSLLDMSGPTGMTLRNSGASSGFSFFDRPSVPGDQVVFQGNAGNYSLFNVSTRGANVGTEKASGMAFWTVDIANTANATMFQMQYMPAFGPVFFTHKFGTGAQGDKKISFQTAWQNTSSAPTQLVLDTSGSVGIGTATPSPASKLHVAGNITVDGNINAKYQDLAEWVPTTQKLAAGTVVVLDKSVTNHVLASSRAYDTKVAGVISAQPGIALGEAGDGKVLVATTGRVKVRVDATRGAIEVGDLLVTGEVEGVAMKSVPVELGGVAIHRPGTIIGKALEPLEKGVGEILVLLSLQ